MPANQPVSFGSSLRSRPERERERESGAIARRQEGGVLGEGGGDDARARKGVEGRRAGWSEGERGRRAEGAWR